MPDDDDDDSSTALPPKHDWLSRLGVSNLPTGGTSDASPQDSSDTMTVAPEDPAPPPADTAPQDPPLDPNGMSVPSDDQAPPPADTAPQDPPPDPNGMSVPSDDQAIPPADAAPQDPPQDEAPPAPTDDGDAGVAPEETPTDPEGVSVAPLDVPNAPVIRTPPDKTYRPQYDYYGLGFADGSRGVIGQCPADADQDEMAGYDKGYNDGLNSSATKPVDGPTADATPAGEELVHRLIWVLSDDGVRVEQKDFVGTKADLDAIQSGALRQIHDKYGSNAIDAADEATKGRPPAEVEGMPDPFVPTLR
jgi:hypothetical protein